MGKVDRLGDRIGLSTYRRRCLLDDRFLSELQGLLLRFAPQWSSDLHIYIDKRRRSTPLDVGDANALASAVASQIARKGEVFHRLGGDTRAVLGTVELRGATDALIAVISVDEREFFGRAGEWSFGNTVSLQMRGGQVDGRPIALWTREVFEALVDVFGPDYGYARTEQEYFAKNMCTQGGVWAVGRDISRHLPGIYWLNFFGKPYRDLIDRHKLLTAPASGKREIGNGVLLSLSDDPLSWNTEGYLQVENAVLDHIGRQFFFSKQNPDRETVAPDFGLRSGR